MILKFTAYWFGQFPFLYELDSGSSTSLVEVFPWPTQYLIACMMDYPKWNSKSYLMNSLPKHKVPAF